MKNNIKITPRSGYTKQTKSTKSNIIKKSKKTTQKSKQRSDIKETVTINSNKRKLKARSGVSNINRSKQTMTTVVNKV